VPAPCLTDNARMSGAASLMTETTSTRRRALPWLALSTVYVVWGSTYLAIRVVVHELPPFAAAGLRFVAAGLAMLGLSALVERPWRTPTRRQLAQYTLVGLLLLAGANGLVMWSEQTVPSGITALIVATVPVWITLLDGLRPNGRPWTARVWVGAFVGLVGVALLVRPEPGGATVSWLGIAALQSAALFWSVGSIYAQAIPERLPVMRAAAIEMLAGAGGLALVSTLTGERLGAFLVASSTAWAALAYLAVAGSLIGFTAFAYALHELPASTAGTYAYVNPVVAVALGALILGEPVSASLVLGAALILVGVLTMK
jgi:drug/metabolite transporter (DMT)-like permease